MSAIKFKNFTEESFSWKWNGNEFTFPAGMEIYLDEHEAKHFAKHLVDRELNKLKIPTNNLTERAKLEIQCFPTDESVTPLVALNINEVEKKKTKSSKKVEEEEFKDLKKK